MGSTSVNCTSARNTMVTTEGVEMEVRSCNTVSSWWQCDAEAQALGTIDLSQGVCNELLVDRCSEYARESCDGRVHGRGKGCGRGGGQRLLWQKLSSLRRWWSSKKPLRDPSYHLVSCNKIWHTKFCLEMSFVSIVFICQYNLDQVNCELLDLSVL